MAGFISRGNVKPYNIASDKNYTSKVNKREVKGVTGVVKTAVSTTYTRPTIRKPSTSFGSPAGPSTSYAPITVKTGERGPTSAPASLESQAKAKAPAGKSSMDSSASTTGSSATATPRKGKSKTLFNANAGQSGSSYRKKLTGV